MPPSGTDKSRCVRCPRESASDFCHLPGRQPSQDSPLPPVLLYWPAAPGARLLAPQAQPASQPCRLPKPAHRRTAPTGRRSAMHRGQSATHKSEGLPEFLPDRPLSLSIPPFAGGKHAPVQRALPRFYARSEHLPETSPDAAKQSAKPACRWIPCCPEH